MTSATALPSFNFGGISNINKGSPDIREEVGFKYKLMEVGINEGLAEQIDQFLFNELANANLDPMERDWAMRYFDIISTYLFASTSNDNSGRKYDCSLLILKAYERARVLVVSSKAKGGWAFETVLKQKHQVENIQKSYERVDQGKANGKFNEQEIKEMQSGIQN